MEEADSYVALGATYSSVLNMEVPGSSETLISTYEARYSNIPKNNRLKTGDREMKRRGVREG
jgi:hypothetical protein